MQTFKKLTNMTQVTSLYQSPEYNLEKLYSQLGMIQFYLAQATTPEGKKEWRDKLESKQSEIEKVTFELKEELNP